MGFMGGSTTRLEDKSALGHKGWINWEDRKRL